MLILYISIIMNAGKLWIFGDSYGTFHRDGDELKDWHWMWSLTEKLGHENFHNICKDGIANEWTYYQFIDSSPLINKSTDTIIFITTQIDRQWFFPDNEGVGNILMGVDDYVTKDQSKAIDMYSRHLTDNPQNHIRFQWLLYALNFLKRKEDLNLLVLPGFENEGFFLNDHVDVKGSLLNPCVAEVKGRTMKDWQKWMGKQHGLDPREGHLSECNHLILSEKLFETIKNNTTLDLTTGFKREFLN